MPLISIESKLDAILKEDIVGAGSDDSFQVALGIMAELDEARQRVADLERQLLHATDRLCGGLALGVRRNQPGLNIGLDRGNCKVGYRSKHLLFKPDLANKTWVVQSSDPTFGRRFQRMHGPRLDLTGDLSGTAGAIAKFFTDHYRSLGEDIMGNGVVLHEGMKISMGRLAEMIDDQDHWLREVSL